MPGKSQKDIVVVHIYIVNASSVLWFRKRQMYQIRWILHTPNSEMLALVSKYTIDGTIGGWFKPTYRKSNQIHLEILMQLENTRH